MFGAELDSMLHENAAALLYSVVRNHALIDGNKRTAWLALRIFLRFNGLSASVAPPPVFIVSPYIEEVAQDNIDVRLSPSACRTGSRFPDAR
ncbi:type II toxin-antitoxin system death-on-curing family toxin [Streptomyces sp. NPDC056323]|uniref:type II toxin-antitoxin system death-on-curing family toxin n=1 Tax=unclassified Streptomyces TaxID=2593676 RepID=UPI0035E04DBA